jgi:molybdopterin-binding protein
MSQATPLLRVSALRRRYGDRTIVDVASLEVAAGEVLAILGPNGAGKSTLFRMLLLLEPADAGTIELGGAAIHPGDPVAARRIAGVFQRPFLFSGTVRGNIEVGLRARGVERAERMARVGEALAQLSLTSLADADVRSLSGGEAQRVALARALVVRPELLILDEPTSSLDVTLRARFREDLVRMLHTQVCSAVLITHDAADAYALADRVAVMQDGRIVQCGTPEDIVLAPATPFVAAFTGADLFLHGTVSASDEQLITVRLSGGALMLATATGEARERLRTGEPAQVAYRPEDVVLATGSGPGETSAQNRFLMRVASIAPSGALVRVKLEGQIGLVALLTRQGAESLRLQAGMDVVAQLKAAAVRAFPAA